MSIIKGFVTNLGKYNEGELIGEWVDFPCNEDEWEEVLERIGIDEKYEEYFFSDWEIELDNANTLEMYLSYDEVNDLAWDLEILDYNERGKLEAIMELETSDIANALNYMRDYEFISGYTLEEYVREDLDCLGNIPDYVMDYIDFEQLGSDHYYNVRESENGVLIG